MSHADAYLEVYAYIDLDRDEMFDVEIQHGYSNPRPGIVEVFRVKASRTKTHRDEWETVYTFRGRLRMKSGAAGKTVWPGTFDGEDRRELMPPELIARLDAALAGITAEAFNEAWAAEGPGSVILDAQAVAAGQVRLPPGAAVGDLVAWFDPRQLTTREG